MHAYYLKFSRQESWGGRAISFGFLFEHAHTSHSDADSCEYSIPCMYVCMNEWMCMHVLMFSVYVFLICVRVTCMFVCMDDVYIYIHIYIYIIICIHGQSWYIYAWCLYPFLYLCMHARIWAFTTHSCFKVMWICLWNLVGISKDFKVMWIF